MTETWELDFYSRPILDEQQKKLWEVLICNDQRTFEFSRWCAGSEANARWLQDALSAAIAAWRAQQGLDESAQPERVRFFRRPMTAIITRACEALAIPATASRRTYAIAQWLQERFQTVYPQHPGFQPLMPPPPQFEPQQPAPLPEQLLGEGWALVNLPFQELASLEEWEVTFRDGIPLSLLNLEPDKTIPGLLVFSQRAVPLAGWLSGLEVAAIAYEPETARLLLETGLSDRWILAPLPTAPMQAEAAAFATAKQQAQNIHFLAVQTDAASESFAGFWLLQDLMLD